MADNDHEDHGPFDPAPELARTMIGTAPLFEADSAGGTAILPAIGDSHEARELVCAAQRELESSTEYPREQARLHHGLAVVFDERLDDPHAALLHYQRACELDPENRTYLGAALRCYLARQSWTLALGLLDVELELAPTPAERAQVLTDKALIYDEWLAHGSAARGAL
jgi:tetratricopeptide (TPR) repeat protein